MPTDAELRTLFHEASTPPPSIDAAAVIRRSKRRRLPQQLGAGSVLTLAVAGIGVAGFTGLRGLTPSASETAADAPRGVAESGPFAGTDSTESERDASCVTDAADATSNAVLDLEGRFPASAAAGERVTGALTLTNAGTEPVEAVTLAPTVTLARGGEVLHHRDTAATGTTVALAPGESVDIAVSFDTVGCDADGRATGTALEAGEYTVAAVLELRQPDGSIRVIGGPASVISLR
jgi:hypothetical protein